MPVKAEEYDIVLWGEWWLDAAKEVVACSEVWKVGEGNAQGLRGASDDCIEWAETGTLSVASDAWKSFCSSRRLA